MADHHGAAGEALQRLFERAQRLDVEVVGRFVEQRDVAALLQHLGEMDAVTLTARQLADLLLLVLALEVECADIGTRAQSSCLPKRNTSSLSEISSQTILVGVEIVAALVDIAELDRLADLDRAAIRLFVAGDQLELGRLALAVKPRSRLRYRQAAARNRDTRTAACRHRP